MITTKLLRGSLDDAWDAAQAAPRGLRAQLRIFETRARSRIDAGSLSSVSANGRTTGFSNWGAGSVTPAEWQDVWRSLIDLFDIEQKKITRDQSLSVPAGDDVVYAAMQCYLVPCTESFPDMTWLRLQPPEPVQSSPTVVDHRTKAFDNMAALMADGYLYDRKPVFLRGLTTPGDGQGGWYTFDASSVLAHNPLLVIKPTGTGAGLGAYIKDA